MDKKLMLFMGIGATVLIIIIILVLTMKHSSKTVIKSAGGSVEVPKYTSPKATAQVVDVKVPDTTAPNTTFPNTTVPTKTVSVIVSDTLPINTVFSEGDKLVSKNKEYTLTITKDNELVVYKDGANGARILSWRDKPVKYMELNANGVLTIAWLDGSGYTSNTDNVSVPGSVLQISDEGNLCLISPTGECVWALTYSGTISGYPYRM